MPGVTAELMSPPQPRTYQLRLRCASQQCCANGCTFRAWRKPVPRGLPYTLNPRRAAAEKKRFLELPFGSDATET